MTRGSNLAINYMWGGGVVGYLHYWYEFQIFFSRFAGSTLEWETWCPHRELISRTTCKTGEAPFSHTCECGFSVTTCSNEFGPFLQVICVINSSVQFSALFVRSCNVFFIRLRRCYVKICRFDPIRVLVVCILHHTTVGRNTDVI